jgi:hypothetical protein
VLRLHWRSTLLGSIVDDVRGDGELLSMKGECRALYRWYGPVSIELFEGFKMNHCLRLTYELSRIQKRQGLEIHSWA